jgi:hypothetical protein
MLSFSFRRVLSLGLLLLAGFPCSGQNQTDAPLPPPFMIVQTGIGFQLFEDGFKMSTLSVEWPVGHYCNLGLQGNFFHRNNDQEVYFDPYGYEEFLSSQEYGLSAEYFLHGRLSGRKSGLYLGVQMMFGSRKYQYNQSFVFPPQPDFVQYKIATTKAMFKWGMQWRFGKFASLEFSSPFGIEFSKPSDPVSSFDDDSRFIIMPQLQLGIAL